MDKNVTFATGVVFATVGLWKSQAAGKWAVWGEVGIFPYNLVPFGGEVERRPTKSN